MTTINIDRIRERASLLSDNDWAFIIELATYEFDCNENPKARIVINKLTAPSITMAERTARQRTIRKTNKNWK